MPESGPPSTPQNPGDDPAESEPQTPGWDHPAESGPPSTPQNREWRQLEQIAARAAEVAAAMLRAEAGNRRRITTKSSRTDLVTDMDLACEAAIVDFLSTHRPDDGVMGEEGAVGDGTSGVRWIIDPIDGTVNFVHGHPGFGVSVAAEAGGRVVAGAVLDPVLNEAFTAHRGGGARLDGLPLTVGPDDDLAVALVATGFSYQHERRRRQAEVLGELLPLIGDIRRVGGAAIDLCWVACGRVNAFFEVGLNPWDYAAGALIAAEAGAVVQDLHGGPPSTDFVFAAAPGVADSLLKLLQTAAADRI